MTRFSNIQAWRLYLLPSFILFLSLYANAQGVLPPEKMDVVFENTTGVDPYETSGSIDAPVLLSTIYKVKAIVKLSGSQEIGLLNFKLFDQNNQLLLDSISDVLGASGLPSEVDGEYVYVNLGNFPNMGYGGEIECHITNSGGDVSETVKVNW